MHSISRIRYSLSEAQTLFGDVLHRPFVDDTLDDGFIVGKEIELSRGANPRAPQVALVIWVPPALKRKLAVWSAAVIDYVNFQTNNLLQNWVFACFESGNESLYLPCDFFPTLDMTGQTVARLVFVSDDQVVDVVHRYTDDDAETLICGLQGQYACAGPNYNPYLIYSEEKLAAVEHLGTFTKFPGWVVLTDDK